MLSITIYVPILGDPQCILPRAGHSPWCPDAVQPHRKEPSSVHRQRQPRGQVQRPLTVPFRRPGQPGGTQHQVSSTNVLWICITCNILINIHPYNGSHMIRSPTGFVHSVWLLYFACLAFLCMHKTLHMSYKERAVVTWVDPATSFS